MSTILNTSNNIFFYKNITIYILNLNLFFFLIVYSFNLENNIENDIDWQINLNLNLFLLLVLLLFILFYLIFINRSRIEKKDNNPEIQLYIKNLVDNTFIRCKLDPLFNLYEKYLFFYICYFWFLFKLTKFIYDFIFGVNYLFLDQLNNLFLLIFFINLLIYLCIWFISDILVFFLLLPYCFSFKSPLDTEVSDTKYKNLKRFTLLRRSIIPLGALFGTFVTVNFVHQIFWPDFDPPLKRMGEYVGFQQYMREKFDYPPMESKIKDKD